MSKHTLVTNSKFYLYNNIIWLFTFISSRIYCWKGIQAHLRIWLRWGNNRFVTRSTVLLMEVSLVIYKRRRHAESRGRVPGLLHHDGGHPGQPDPLPAPLHHHQAPLQAEVPGAIQRWWEVQGHHQLHGEVGCKAQTNNNNNIFLVWRWQQPCRPTLTRERWSPSLEATSASGLASVSCSSGVIFLSHCYAGGRKSKSDLNDTTKNWIHTTYIIFIQIK